MAQDKNWDLIQCLFVDHNLLLVHPFDTQLSCWCCSKIGKPIIFADYFALRIHVLAEHFGKDEFLEFISTIKNAN